MLPLHGQSTAAVKNFQWAGPTLYIINSKSHVFDKQAEYEFAEFLYIIYIVHKLLILKFNKFKMQKIENTHFSIKSNL